MIRTRRTIASLALILLGAFAAAASGTQPRNDGAPSPKAGEPARPAFEGCAWQRLSDAAVGLAAWVQHCDFGDRQITLSLQPDGLVARYSDGSAAEPLVDVFDRLPAETVEAGLQRVYASRTDPALVKRCVLAVHPQSQPVSGVQRFNFEPDPAYRKELAAQADPNDVPEPPCGDMGIAPDGVRYFEVQPASNARKILFVRAGQDEPLFDERSLQPLGAAASAVVDDGCCRYRAGPNGISADFLLETCSVTGHTAHGMIPYFDCQSYVLAVLDSYKAMQAEVPKKRRLCLPPDLSARAVLDAVEAHFVHERDAPRRAAEVILASLQTSYACRK